MPSCIFHYIFIIATQWRFNDVDSFDNIILVVFVLWFSKFEIGYPWLYATYTIIYISLLFIYLHKSYNQSAI